MSILAKQRSILRCFGTLILTLVSVAALLILGGFLRYDAELNTSRRISDFHLRTMLLLGEIEAQIAEVQNQRAFQGDGSDLLGASLAPIESIHRTLADVTELQRDHGEELFVRTLERARLHSDQILALAAAEARNAGRYDNELASLGFTVHQLERLHAIAVDDLLDESSSTGLRSASVLGAVAAALLILLAVVVARLFILVRARLQELHRAEQDLRETQAQLVQSQKLEAIGTLVGGIAHDFNNILTTILGYSEALASRLDPEDVSCEHARQIREAAVRAAAITRQLLLFSRPDFSEPRVVDIGALMRDILPILRRLIRADIQLDLELEEPLGGVFMDPVQIEQVLMNLTLNARDAMPEGGKLILRGGACGLDDEAARGLQLEPETYVQITVSDDGLGMSDETRARIFEPFFTTKPRGKGTGLGLSMVHGIVTRAGGGIRARSELGKGTTIEVFLPSCEPAPPMPVELVSEPPRGAGETILVVEDQDMVRRVTEAVLREAGYDTLAAADADEAERQCREHRNDIALILSDVVMPGARGPDLVERLLELCPGSAVVFMSGYFEEEILERVRVSNHSFIPKPFHPTKLCEVVAEALAQQRTGLITADERSGG